MEDVIREWHVEQSCTDSTSRPPQSLPAPSMRYDVPGLLSSHSLPDFAHPVVAAPLLFFIVLSHCHLRLLCLPICPRLCLHCLTTTRTMAPPSSAPRLSPPNSPPPKTVHNHRPGELHPSPSCPLAPPCPSQSIPYLHFFFLEQEHREHIVLSLLPLMAATSPSLSSSTR